MKTVVAPFQSILGRILKFLQFTILGYAFNRLVTFFSNPKNQKKIEAIGRFLKDWWPSLLGVAALFFTPLGVLVKGVISLMRFAIPALLKIVKRNPYTALAWLVFLVLVLFQSYFQKAKKQQWKEVIQEA